MSKLQFVRLKIDLQQMRYFLVAAGLVGAACFMLFMPSGHVEMFPIAALWVSGLLLCWAVLMTGMFIGSRGGALGPLLLGTLGAAAILVFLH